MRGSPQGPIANLRANTVVWIAVVIWLVWGYLGQTPPGGPYTEGLREIFVAIIAVVVPVITLILVFGWILALRDPQRQRGSDR
jgi:hypothetical protein